MAVKKNRRISPALLAAAATGVAAGYYFYASKNAKRNRRVVAKWATDLKKEVVGQAKNLKSLDRGTIAGVVDEVVKMYGRVRDVDRSDIERAARALKVNWQKIADEIRGKSGGKKRKARSRAVRKKS